MPKFDGLTKAIAALTTSVIGVTGAALIMTAEGKENRSYLDAAGIPTICYGHTGPEVKLGQVKSDAECDAIFMEDVRKHQAPITSGHKQNCIGNVLLNYNQRDAVTSFIFNVGNGAFCKSTMASRLKVGNYSAAALEFPKWNKATVRGQKVVLRGLTARRKAEQDLFNSLEDWEPYDNKDNPLKVVVRIK